MVVSAGPSLRKNKHLLKDVQDKAVIIAVQTTFQPLLEMGVEPHFVTSLDYHEICTRFFENLPDLDGRLARSWSPSPRRPARSSDSTPAPSRCWATSTPTACSAR